jgi:hypothetical protein
MTHITPPPPPPPPRKCKMQLEQGRQEGKQNDELMGGFAEE